MAAAGMAFTVVMVVMAAAGVGIVVQGAAEEQLHSLVCIAGNTAVNGNARIVQCGTGAAAQTAADQNFDALLIQKTCQSAVAAAVGVQNLRGQDLAVFHFVDLELSRVTKVLVDAAVFISNCDFY